MDRVPRPEDFNDPSMGRGGGAMPNFSSSEGNLFALLSAMGGSQPGPAIRRPDENAFDPSSMRGAGMGGGGMAEAPVPPAPMAGMGGAPMGRAPGGDFGSDMGDPLGFLGGMNPGAMGMPGDQTMGMNPLAKRQALAKLLLRAKSGQRF